MVAIRMRGKSGHVLLLACFVLCLSHSTGELVRPSNVYKGVIRGVHDYFNNTCILLMHADPDPMEFKAPEYGVKLLELQKYFSGDLKIRTSIMDFQMFITRIGQSYNHIKRPLFVLLNDSDELRYQFTYQVSKWIDMAYPVWLIFLRNETNISDFFEDINIPFDCVFLVAREDPLGGEVLRDVYRIYPEDNLRKMRFGRWDQEHGLIGPTVGLYSRRNDLYGLTIRAVSIHDPPASLLLKNETGDVVGVGGFYGEVLELLALGMNCTFSYIEAESWGTKLPNGSWTGAIGMLIEGVADIAAMELMMTRDRLDAIEFSTPVYATKCRIYIKRPDSRPVKWDAYSAPFAKLIWYALGLLILMGGGAILLIEGAAKQLSKYRNEELRSHKYLELLFYVFGAFCSQGMPTSIFDPVRAVNLTIHLTGVVVVAAYSAALISFLALRTFVMPFDTMEGLLNDGTYRFAALQDSADYTFFQNSTDKLLSRMFRNMLVLETDLPKTYLEGLNRICQEDNYAFMTIDVMVEALRKKVGCYIEPLDVIVQSTVAMPVPFHSPYRRFINNNILLMRDSGILQRMLQIEKATDDSRAGSSWTSVEIEDVLPLVVFLAGGLVMTVFVFLMERVAWQKEAMQLEMQERVKQIKLKIAAEHM